MAIVVEQRHIDAARLAGACGELNAVRPGMAVEDVQQAWLIWFAEHCPDLAREIEEAAKLPIWTLSGSGYGYGYGDGYGDGYGYGPGYGYGDGDGYGSGYGYGYGFGDGDGSGYGDGYGYGYGDGYGDGDGSGRPRAGEEDQTK